MLNNVGSVVLCSCETWSLKNRLKVFENRVLRRIGLKRDEMVDGLKKLHNEGLHNLYFLPNIIIVMKCRSIEWAGHVARLEERRSRVLVSKLV
jgi:hypothetical protein